MNDTKKNYYEAFLAESSAALFSEILIYPAHTVWSVQQKDNLSFLKAFHEIRGSRDYASFYKGFSIAAMSCLPAIMLYLWGAQFAITHFGDNHVGQMMQGPFAQVFAAVVTVPAIRMIELEQISKSSVKATSFKQLPIYRQSHNIWHHSGVFGFYRGAMPQLFIDSVSDGLGFWFRARLLSCFPKEQSNQPGPQLFSTVFGFALGHFLLTPLSAVKTRMGFHEVNPDVFRDTRFFPSMCTLYRQRGVKGFFVGASASVVYGAISSLPVACSGCFDHK